MSHAHEYGPIVHHRLVVRHLIQERLKANFKQTEVAQKLGWSHAKMMRYESGKQVFPKSEMDALLRLYWISTKPLGKAISEWGNNAREKGWWDTFRPSIPTAYRQYIALEHGAEHRHHVAVSTLPDQLRTPAYSTLIDAHHPVIPDASMAVEIVQSRQHHTQPTTHDTFVLDENVLRRHVGKTTDPHIMGHQIDHIIARADQPNIDVHIIPADSDWHPAMRTQFSVMSFGDMLDDITHTYTPTAPYAADPDTTLTIDAVRHLIDHTTEPSEQTIDRLKAIRADFP